jgi:CheY-like chemotaxis protein
MRQEQPADGLRSVPADWVDHIHASGRHLLGLINDILDLAKVEAGRLDLRPAPLRLDDAVPETLTGLAPLLQAKDLRVETHLPALTALADPVRFRQVMENLLSNAIKFTPEGGRISVTATGTPSVVAVTVTDTGVGIDPADHARVFEEFQQVGDREKRRAGTGLGLALTKRLVEAHGGEIGLISQLGQGSSFTVRLPAAPPPPAETEPTSAVHGSQRRVLLIEDDAAGAELLRTHLRGAGYLVDVAGSGEAGLARACASPPDAIVLDVTLPDIDGWEVMRRLRAEQRLARIPVFFASIVDERQMGLALGAADYFVKPVDQSALLGALSRHVAVQPASNPPRVLVVDHNEVQRRAVEESLRSSGADVVGCSDSGQGLALSRDRHFDLIVCDLQMPGLDGFSLLAAIEQDPATADTPVVAVTAVADAVRGPNGAGPLLAAAIAGGAGWGTLASLIGDAQAHQEVTG